MLYHLMSSFRLALLLLGAGPRVELPRYTRRRHGRLQLPAGHLRQPPATGGCGDGHGAAAGGQGEQLAGGAEEEMAP